MVQDVAQLEQEYLAAQAEYDQARVAYDADPARTEQGLMALGELAIEAKRAKQRWEEAAAVTP